MAGPLATMGTAFVIVAAPGLTACDYLTRMERTTTFSAAMPLQCIDDALASAPFVQELRVVGNQRSINEYLVTGIDGGNVYLASPISHPETLSIAFGWLGKTGDEENEPAQALLEQTHQAILAGCTEIDVIDVTEFCSPNIGCGENKVSSRS